MIQSRAGLCGALFEISGQEVVATRQTEAEKVVHVHIRVLGLATTLGDERDRGGQATGPCAGRHARTFALEPQFESEAGRVQAIRACCQTHRDVVVRAVEIDGVAAGRLARRAVAAHQREDDDRKGDYARTSHTSGIGAVKLRHQVRPLLIKSEDGVRQRQENGSSPFGMIGGRKSMRQVRWRSASTSRASRASRVSRAKQIKSDLLFCIWYWR